MMPTEVQQKTMHAMSIDCLPWPKIRDHLCLHIHQEEVHNVRLYLESVEFMWPKDKPLLVRGGENGIVIHPEFEEYASNLANWHIGSPWRDACPDLHHLVSE